MAIQEIGISCKMELSVEYESDIISFVSSLKDKGALGEYITHLIKKEFRAGRATGSDSEALRKIAQTISDSGNKQVESINKLAELIQGIKLTTQTAGNGGVASEMHSVNPAGIEKRETYTVYESVLEDEEDSGELTEIKFGAGGLDRLSSFLGE
jgi:hypothetical protein